MSAAIACGDDEVRNDAPPTTAIGAGVRSGWSDPGLLGATAGADVRAVGGADARALGGAGGTDGADGAEPRALGATDGTVRGAIDGGAGGAIDGARGAMGALLARGGIDAGRAADAGAGAGARPEASDMRRVPGAALTGAGSPVSAAMALAMSGERPCAVSASS
jgi:hypothetical protein